MGYNRLSQAALCFTTKLFASNANDSCSTYLVTYSIYIQMWSEQNMLTHSLPGFTFLNLLLVFYGFEMSPYLVKFA